MDRHARASPGMPRGATSPTSLLSPPAGVLEGPSPRACGGPGHPAGKVLCVQGVTGVGNIFCMNNQSFRQDVPGMLVSLDIC